MTRPLAIALAVAIAAAGLQSWRLAAEQRSHADTKTIHAEQLAALAEAARRAEANARTEEQRRTAEVQKAADEAHRAMEDARRDAAAAADAGQRLRHRIAELTAACRVSASGSAATAPGASVSATADLLADVQRRLDQAADGIAAHADAARTAGLACERSYDALNR